MLENKGIILLLLIKGRFISLVLPNHFLKDLLKVILKVQTYLQAASAAVWLNQ